MTAWLIILTVALILVFILLLWFNWNRRKDIDELRRWLAGDSTTDTPQQNSVKANLVWAVQQIIANHGGSGGGITDPPKVPRTP
jgi:H+/Cl- antiporter ClcA